MVSGTVFGGVMLSGSTSSFAKCDEVRTRIQGLMKALNQRSLRVHLQVCKIAQCVKLQRSETALRSFIHSFIFRSLGQP